MRSEVAPAHLRLLFGPNDHARHLLSGVLVTPTRRRRRHPSVIADLDHRQTPERKDRQTPASQTVENIEDRQDRQQNELGALGSTPPPQSIGGFGGVGGLAPEEESIEL